MSLMELPRSLFTLDLVYTVTLEPDEATALAAILGADAEKHHDGTGKTLVAFTEAGYDRLTAGGTRYFIDEWGTLWTSSGTWLTDMEIM